MAHINQTMIISISIISLAIIIAAGYFLIPWQGKAPVEPPGNAPPRPTTMPPIDADAPTSTETATFTLTPRTSSLPPPWRVSTGTSAAMATHPHCQPR